MALQTEQWAIWGGGGDDNGNTAPLRTDVAGQGLWVFATPLLQFVNTHSNESFVFSGIVEYDTLDPQPGSVAQKHGSGDWANFGTWMPWVADYNVIIIYWGIRLRNANASAIANVQFWG
jgi:hypothetical protein